MQVHMARCNHRSPNHFQTICIQELLFKSYQPIPYSFCCSCKASVSQNLALWGGKDVLACYCCSTSILCATTVSFPFQHNTATLILKCYRMQQMKYRIVSSHSAVIAPNPTKQAGNMLSCIKKISTFFPSLSENSGNLHQSSTIFCRRKLPLKKQCEWFNHKTSVQ